MKKNVFIRIMAALGGLTLWMTGLCALAETFFRIPVTARLGQLLGAHTPLAVLLTLVLAILLCTFGVCCWMMLSTRRAVKRTGFVMQKGENGAIGVSIRSIEGLVQTCVRQHDVVSSAEISVVERRDGIVILLNIQEAAGVNIPLAVGALQKQIKQYVNTCTGVDVHEVRVMVENTESMVGPSPYAVQEPVVMTTAATAAEMQREAAAAEALAPVEEIAAAEEIPEEVAAEPVVTEEISAEAPVEEPVPEAEAATPAEEPVPAPQPVHVVMPVMPEIPEEEDDRPLHQRLFGAEEEPVFVPAPPELVVEPVVEESAEEAIPEAAEEIIEEPAADEVDANAVLEVVAAMAEEAVREDEAEEAAAEEIALQDEDEEDK